MKIGGIDNGVIKDINTDNPYVPGSSLKGKMRSLLEWRIGVVGIGDGKPFHSGLLTDTIFNDVSKKETALTLLKIFGNGKTDDKFNELTRISVGDCSLIEVEEQKISEAKYENVIDRKSGTASNPRQTERVPAGVKFEFDIRLKILDGDNEEVFKQMVEDGLELVANDYLGGSGSRGYGRVKFVNEESSDNKPVWSE
jgi:CRISPR-associated protein Csm3